MPGQTARISHGVTDDIVAKWLPDVVKLHLIIVFKGDSCYLVDK